MADRPVTKYARAGDLHLAYQVVGNGPVDLVMVSGTPSHVELQWENPMGAYLLDRLAGFARVVTFDKRGSGLSDAAANQPTLEERMDDVRAVMDAAGSERAVIFGQSEGSPMAMLFAATYPERVSSLALYGSIVRWVGHDFDGAIDPDDFARQLGEVVDHWGEGRLADWFAPTITASPLGPMVREGFGAFERASMSPGAFRDLMRLNAQIDVRGVVDAINVPTLVLHRRDDPFISVEQSRWLADRLNAGRYVELDGSDHVLIAGEVEVVLDEIEEFITGTRHVPPVGRVLATVLFTDIVASTEQAGRMGDARWAEVLDRHTEQLRATIAKHGGQTVNTTGDGIVATFDGPGRAANCALAAVRTSAQSGLQIRVGLHTGELERRGADISGIAVHTAARVMAEAEPGHVYCTRTVKDLVIGAGLKFTPQGERTLKGIPDRWELYSLNG